MIENRLGITAIGFAMVLGIVACGGGVTEATGGAGGTGNTGGATNTGGTSTQSTAGGTPGSATAQSYCEGKTAREQKCDPANTETLSQCLADSDTTCIFTGIRPDVRDALVACLNGRECNTGDDGCYYETGLVNPAAGQNEYISACVAKVDECSGSLENDFCGITLLASKDYVTLGACLQGPCNAVGTCLETAFEAICPHK